MPFSRKRRRIVRRVRRAFARPQRRRKSGRVRFLTRKRVRKWGPSKRSYGKKRSTNQMTRAIGWRFPPVMRIIDQICHVANLTTENGATDIDYQMDIKGNSLFEPLIGLPGGPGTTVDSVGRLGQMYERCRVIGSRIELKVMWNVNATSPVALYWHTEARDPQVDGFSNTTLQTLECNVKASHTPWFQDVLAGGSNPMKVIRDYRSSSSQFGRFIKRGIDAEMDNGIRGSVSMSCSTACPSIIAADPVANWVWEFNLHTMNNSLLAIDTSFAFMVVKVDYYIEFYGRREVAGGS